MFATGEDPFKFWVRMDQGHQTCGIRYEMQVGRAVLSLPLQSREDPAPVSHYEELDIPAEVMRAGRFLQVLPSGNRRSYGLSSLTAEAVGRLEANRWVELEPISEQGFRYLILPRNAGSDRPAAVSVPAGTPVPAARAAAGGDRPPRQVPVAPALAREALSRLSHQDAIGYLQAEMAKVEALHQHLSELERRLAASEAREKDLMTVLQRWQAH